MSRRKRKIRKRTAEKATQKKKAVRALKRTDSTRLSPAEHRLDKRAEAKLEAENINKVDAQPTHKGRYESVTIANLKVDNSFSVRLLSARLRRS